MSFKSNFSFKMKRTILGVIFELMNLGVSFAQVVNDSLAEDFRTMAAKNFSRYRTVNFSWEMDADHDYSFGLDAKVQENCCDDGLEEYAPNQFLGRFDGHDFV